MDQSTPKPTERLPAEVQHLLDSGDLDTKVQTLGTKYKFHIDQMADLRDEIYLTIIGAAKREEFVANTMEGLSLSTEVATALAKDVNETIFEPVREAMKAVPPIPTAAPEAAAKATPDSAAPSPSQKPAELHPADVMLSQKTVTLAPPMPPKPQPYKADPYRESVE